MSHPSAHNSVPFLIPSDLNPGRREHYAPSQMTKTAATDAIVLVVKLPFETDPEEQDEPTDLQATDHLARES